MKTLLLISLKKKKRSDSNYPSTEKYSVTSSFEELSPDSTYPYSSSPILLLFTAQTLLRGVVCTHCHQFLSFSFLSPLESGFLPHRHSKTVIVPDTANCNKAQRSVLNAHPVWAASNFWHNRSLPPPWNTFFSWFLETLVDFPLSHWLILLKLFCWLSSSAWSHSVEVLQDISLGPILFSVYTYSFADLIQFLDFR